MLEIDPNKIITKDLHQYLLSSIGPRPIALASTIDLKGNKNVSPFSFFNIFSADPPIAIFSPARRIRNNTTKDTLNNIHQIQEVVINIVNYDLVEQTSLASSEYPPEIDEFMKAGLTPVKSKKIKPFRVKESPVQMECEVTQIIELGQNGGAGNLIICKILLIHIDKNILNQNNQIDQNKIKLVGRMGGKWYSKGFNESLFSIKKPVKNLGIGFDNISNRIKNSDIFQQNDLTKLASIEKLPSEEAINEFKKNKEIESIHQCTNEKEVIEKLHFKAKQYIDSGDIQKAWKCLLVNKLNRKL